MSEQPIEIPVTLDAAGFVSGAGQLTDASSDLQNSFRGLSVSTASVQKLYDVVTPSRAAIAGMGAFAAMAAQTQSRLSGLAATSTVTGVNVNKLGGSIRQMSRDMPLGAKTTTAVVEQFTRMGVAAAGTEKRIGALSKSVLQLSGATGEGPAELADGMTNLARATGNANLDPKRFTSLADSLTTVSKQSGASATSILAFSKNIAPMANAAGIGATGVLGISSAFARLGEDGFGASTAVNKMLTDMSRAVREGGPQMRSYAEIVGKSAGEFERMFRANPTEALTQVTEAIANAGTSGPRLLEQIGVEGVRGQRALQALSASGGLRTAVATATTGYGSGSTEEAAAAAFGGLNDSLTELRETSTQLGEAMGAPLLTPLTHFADALKVPIELLGNIAGSGAGQNVMGVAAQVAIPALLVKSLMGPLTALGLGRQAVTSSPVRALAAGYAEGRGLRPETSRIARFGSPIMNAAQEGIMGEYAARFLNVGRDVGVGVGPVPGQHRAPVAPLRQRLLGGASSLAQLQWNAASTSLMNAATTDPTRRTAVGLDAGPAFKGALDDFKAAFKPGGGGLSESMKVLNTRTAAAGQGIGVMTQTAKAFAKVPVAAAQVAGAAAIDATKGGLGLAKAGLGMIGPGAIAGAAVTGGITMAMMAKSNLDAQRQEITDRGGMDIRGAINTYRESIGMATSSTVTLGNSMSDLSKNVALTTSSFAEARQVTQKEYMAATGGDQEVQTRFAGSRRQVAAQISSLNVTGLGPQELAAIGQDLARSGRSREEVEKILKQVDVAGGGGARGARLGQVAEAVSGASESKRGGFMGFVSRVQGEGSFLTRPGGAFHVGEMGEAGKEQIGIVAGGIAQQKVEQADRYGAAYARQNEARAMNKAVATALKEGNHELADSLSKTFSQTLGFGQVGLSTKDLQEKGYIGALMGEKEGARRQFRNVDLEGGGGVEAREQRGFYAAEMGKRGQEQFASFFDWRNQGQVAQQVQASIAKPEDVKKFSVAVESMTNAARKSGKTFEQISFDAQAAVRGMDTGTPQYAMMQAVAAKAQQGVAAEQITMSPAQRLAQNLRMAQREIALTPTDEPGRQRREAAIQQEQQTKDAMQQQVTARAQQVRQYALSYDRAFQDFDRAQQYAEEDYIRSRGRAQRNFGIQMDRLREDAAKQMYNPYERIMTQPTWDTNNLLVNAKEQTEALEKQSKQLAQLRKAGVSQQAIDTLELYKPENAQQLNTMAGDLLNDPKLRQRLNRTMAARGAAAGDLATDKSNVDVRRMREDFRRGMSDMSKDMDRARERNQEAFRRGIHRMEVDMKRAGQTIAGDAMDLSKKIDKGLAHQAVDWTQVMIDETQVILDAYTNDVVPKVQETIAGSYADFFKTGQMPGQGDQGVRLGAQGGGSVTRDNAGSMWTAPSSTSVNHGPTVVDNRNDFTGSNITVVSNDPDDMAKKSATRTRQANLTATRGVPHGAVQ